MDKCLIRVLTWRRVWASALSGLLYCAVGCSLRASLSFSGPLDVFVRDMSFKVLTLRRPCPQPRLFIYPLFHYVTVHFDIFVNLLT